MLAMAPTAGYAGYRIHKYRKASQERARSILYSDLAGVIEVRDIHQNPQLSDESKCSSVVMRIIIHLQNSAVGEGFAWRQWEEYTPQITEAAERLRSYNDVCAIVERVTDELGFLSVDDCRDAMNQGLDEILNLL